MIFDSVNEAYEFADRLGECRTVSFHASGQVVTTTAHQWQHEPWVARNGLGYSSRRCLRCGERQQARMI